MFLIFLFSILVSTNIGTSLTRPEFNHRLSQMVPKSGPSSSSSFTWVPVPTNAAQQNPLMYTYPFGYVTNQDHHGDTEESFTHIVADGNKNFDSLQPLASVTSYANVPPPPPYGGFGPAPSGGALGPDPYADGSNALAFSAIGLLGFLFFLRLIQDTLDIINGNANFIAPNAVPIGKRSRRSKSTNNVDWIKMVDDVYRFYEQITHEKNLVCRQKTMCQVHLYLVEKYQNDGNAMGILLSDIVGGMSAKFNWTNNDIKTDQNPQDCQLYTNFCS